MNQKLLIVDFENVQQVDFTRLDDNFQVIIFVGASQKSIPIELVTNAQILGNRIQWHQVEGNGNNALDFFIAYQLGRIVETSPQLHCIILSKDKGFDPLLRHLNKAGFRCKRIDSLVELEPKAVKQHNEPHYTRVVELLRKSEKKARPRKRKTLSQHIGAMFQKQIAQTEVDRIINLLFANKLISETNGTLTYAF